MSCQHCNMPARREETYLNHNDPELALARWDVEGGIKVAGQQVSWYHNCMFGEARRGKHGSFAR